MKYIVLNNLTIYPFPTHVPHVDYLATVATPTDRCTGAGFISREWRCYGVSEGLGIGQGTNDQLLLDISLRGLPGV